MLYRKGLVIGRFQPFHKGHVYLIEKALAYAERIVIGIGSANVMDKDNPYSTALRKEMVERFVKREGLVDRVTAIVSLPDVPNDADWLAATLQKTGEIDVVIGNNEWVNGIFENTHIPVVRVGHYQREFLEGKKIRALMRSRKKWDTRVPSYLVSIADKPI